MKNNHVSKANGRSILDTENIASKSGRAVPEIDCLKIHNRLLQMQMLEAQFNQLRAHYHTLEQEQNEHIASVYEQANIPREGYDIDVNAKVFMKKPQAGVTLEAAPNP